MKRTLKFSDVMGAPEDVQKFVTQFRDGLSKFLTDEIVRLMETETYQKAVSLKDRTERTNAKQDFNLACRFMVQLQRDYVSVKGQELIANAAFDIHLARRLAAGLPAPRRIIRCDKGV